MKGFTKIELIVAIVIGLLPILITYGISKIKLPEPSKTASEYSIEKCIKDGGYPITTHDYVYGKEHFIRCDK